MTRIQFIPDSENCLICGSDRLRRFKARASDTTSPTPVHIVECQDCIFAWQYPLSRTQEESIQFFENAYADMGQTQSDYFDPGLKRKIADLELGFVDGLPVRDRTLLDIGAGAGAFATVAAERGWTVTAVDPTLDVERLSDNPMVTAVKGALEQVPDEQEFEIVTLWDVIEHVTDPSALIANATRRLKSGGWLLIETGNYKSADRLNGGTSHWIYQLDHRWYFSPESIAALLNEAGFSELNFSDKVLRPGWSGTVGYSGPSRSRLLKSMIKDPLHISTHLNRHHWLDKARGWKMPGVGIFAVAAKKQERHA